MSYWQPAKVAQKWRDMILASSFRHQTSCSVLNPTCSRFIWLLAIPVSRALQQSRQNWRKAWTRDCKTSPVSNTAVTSGVILVWKVGDQAWGVLIKWGPSPTPKKWGSGPPSRPLKLCLWLYHMQLPQLIKAWRANCKALTKTVKITKQWINMWVSCKLIPLPTVPVPIQTACLLPQNAINLNKMRRHSSFPRFFVKISSSV